MPAVPGTDSRMIAANEVAPSCWISALEVFQRALGLRLLVLGVERAAVQERSVEVHDAGAGVVVGAAARVTGQVDRGVGTAVVGAVPDEHLVAAGVQPRHPHRVLDGVGAAVGEEDLVQIARRALGDQAGRLGAGVVGVRGATVQSFAAWAWMAATTFGC